MTWDRLIGGAATVALYVVADTAMTVGSTRAYTLARGDGMDETVALLVAMSMGGLIVGASLVLLREERGPGAPGTAEGMQLLGLAVMAAADITPGARYGLLGAICCPGRSNNAVAPREVPDAVPLGKLNAVSSTALQ